MLAFTKFAELQTVRQVHLWMRQERLPLPATEYGPEGRKVVWKLPVYNTLHHLLTNPVYAGAYAFGRTGSRITIDAGRKRIVRGFRKDRSAWEVLILDHHEGYITWAEFERNQRLISDNANGKSFMSRGSIRRGEALLAGLLRCGHCGRKLHVAYSGENGSAGRYHCRGGHLNHGSDPCISFGGLRIDLAVGVEVIERVQPLGIEAAIGAMEARRAENAEQRRQVELAIEQARYEAVRARRQYDAVDPDNRLVAAELEQRWNARLLAVHALEDQRDALAASSQTTLTEAERERLLALGADVESAWHSPGATPATRKRIIRTLIEEIVVRVEDDALDLVIRWVGGDHTPLRVRKNRTGQHRWGTDADVVGLDHRARPSASGQNHRGDSQPRRQDHRARQWLDPFARLHHAQSPRDSALPRGRARGAGRGHSQGSSHGSQGERTNGAPAHQGEDPAGHPALQGRSLGDPGLRS